MLIRRVLDTQVLTEKYQSARFTDFLDEAQQEIIKSEIQAGRIGECEWFGGYTSAMRKMAGFFPDWQEASADEFPVKAVKIHKKGAANLTHRDYLGSIMSLGIERKKIGDILVTDDGAYVFVAEDIAGFVVEGIDKIARCGVRCELVSGSQIEIPEPKFKVLDVVAASRRLDAVVAAVCGFSRKAASEYIASGKCSLNHRPAGRGDASVCEGDILSLRGIGRVEIESAGSQTRSGRIHIRIKKFI